VELITSYVLVVISKELHALLGNIPLMVQLALVALLVSSVLLASLPQTVQLVTNLLLDPSNPVLLALPVKLQPGALPLPMSQMAPGQFLVRLPDLIAQPATTALLVL